MDTGVSNRCTVCAPRRPGLRTAAEPPQSPGGPTSHTLCDPSSEQIRWGVVLLNRALMDIRGVALGVWGGLFVAPLSHALSPTVCLAFSGCGLGKSDASCMAYGGGGLGFRSFGFSDVLGVLEAFVLGILKAIFSELGAC